MVSDSRSSRRRAKDDENSNSKGKQSSDKGLSTSSSAASDTNGLRRSSRETLSAKKGVVAVSSSPIRKSERLEKRSPKTPPPEGRRAGKIVTPSSLRRSDRGKSSLSVSSGSKKASKSPSSEAKKRKKGKKKEKSMTQLSLETEEVSESKEGAKRDKRTSAKYKALFQNSAMKKLKKAGLSKKKEKEDKLSQGDSNNCRGENDGIDQDTGGASKRNPVISDSSLRAPAKESVEDSACGKAASSSSMKPGDGKATFEVADDHVLGASGIPRSPMPISVDAVMRNLNVEIEKSPVDSSEVEKEKELELVGSSDGGESEDQIGLKSGQEIISSSRKRMMLDADYDTSGANASKKICTTNANPTPSLPSDRAGGSPIEKCGASSKGQRVDIDSTREGLSSCNANPRQELVSPSLNKDRGEHDASAAVGFSEKSDNLMQQKEQKESPRDLQTVSDQYTCFACKLGGLLLCCEGRGCKRSYHLSCLDPPMDEVPLGVWYCLMCVKKKFESGVHSVSEGVESIWDVKEVSILDVDGLRKEREFFVKYKGLAHIHNRWVPESKLLLDAPSLVAKFNRKSQVVSFKQEWTVPHRLLQKRLFMSAKPCDLLDARYEWLVKWRGLDYEHATWELDNASIFDSPDGQGHIKNFENRRNRVNGAAASKLDKILESGNCSSNKLSQLRSGNSSGSDNFQDYINKLHKFWCESPNAVVIDEQANERIVKIISLVQSFQSNTCGPFLIISTSAALRSWDAAFLQLAPCLNVVVYSGDKNLRKSIRKLEFYEGGCIIFEVLITTLEFVLEDVDVLRGIQWEVIIIDELQRTRISSNCAQIKLLDSKRKLLVVSYQLKENATEYSNLLSLLEAFNYSPNNDLLLTSSSDNIIKLKDKLSKYTVCGWKSDSSRFKEYWVPIQMSNLQVEQYCATLISNSGILCSSHKNDSAGVLRDVLIGSRQCCDHPYIVDKNTPVLLSKGLHESEYLSFGIKASGKFQFLDAVLMEMKKRGLRALILYQEFGKDSIGDYLDDFLRQRYGHDSFERVVGFQINKKQIQIALNKFNNKENGRFVFLLETRGCNSSIKLSSVDTVIIFGSDWNLMTEVRALQKLTLDPPSEQITVFRMYTTFTLEEKILSLSKQEKTIESNLQSMNWNTSHMLLMWGASHQFQILDKFHRDTVATSSPKVLINKTLSKESVEEILQIISSNGRETESKRSSIILNVQKVGGGYRSGSSLPGELENQVMEEGKPHIFWTKLLGGKHFQWKYISGSSQRNRKKVQYFESEAPSDEVVRKRRKVGNSVDPPSKEGAVGTESSPRSPASINGSTRANCASTSTSPSLCKNFLEVPQNYNFDTEERRKLRDAQKSLHLSLKPGISKLCKLLKLTGDAELLVKLFLEYMLSNHHVSSDSPTTLEAFQIAVCWTVASLLKLKIDRRESIALARQHLNFNCRKVETEFAFSMLRCFKTIFAYRTGKLAPGCLSSLERVPELRMAENDILKCINQIHKKFEKKLSKLIEKQEEEKNKLMRSYKEDKLQIDYRLRMEKAVICACFEDSVSMRLDKLKLADTAVAKELEELENKRKTCLKDLEAVQLDARRMLQERGDRWVEAVKAWARRELFGKTPVSETLHWLESQANEEVIIEDSSNGGLDDAVSVHPTSPEEQLLNGLTINAPEKEIQLEGPEMARSSDEVQILVSGGGPSSEDRSPNTTAPTVVANMTKLNVVEKDIQLGVSEMLVSSDAVQNLVSGDEPSSEDQIADTTSVGVAVDEMQLRVPETLSSCDGAVDELAGTATINVANGEIPSSVPEFSHHEVEISHNTEENNEVPTGVSNTSVGTDQQDRLNTAVNESSHQAVSQVESSSVQPAIALNNGDSVPPDQAYQDEPTLPSTSSEIQLQDAPQQNASTEVEGSTAQPIDAAQPDQHAHEATIEPVGQVDLLPSSNSPSSSNLADVILIEEIEHRPRNDHASTQVSQSLTEPIVNAPPVSNQPIFPSLNFSLLPPNGIPIGPSPLGLHLPDLRTMPEFINRSGQPLPILHSLVAPPPCLDPLQKELERLSKEFELTRKSHEDTKLQLKSDRDKEIDEFFAQLNKKYELKHQEEESNFLSKKKEFDERHNRVLMNKFLAEAFRTKCMEIRSTGKSVMQQDANGNFTQQLVQPSMLQNAPRPPLVGASSSGLPAANVQAPAAELTPQGTAPPVISTRNASLPVQAIRPSPNLLIPAVASRPLQVGSISYSSSTQQGGGEVRSRPPHLRNSAAGPGLSTHQRGIPPQPVNLPATTSSTLLSSSIPPQLPTAPHLPRPVDRAPRPQTSRELPSFHNLLSPLDLLNSTDRPATTSSSVGFPSLADWVPNPTAERPNTSEPSTGAMRVNRGSTGRSTDVVYLSDDD